MKNTVIYHSADFDGIFCREIARKFLPDADGNPGNGIQNGSGIWDALITPNWFNGTTDVVWTNSPTGAVFGGEQKRKPRNEPHA